MRHFARLIGLIGLSCLLCGFNTSGITFKSISVAGPSDGVDIPAVLGRPEGVGPFPVVVLLPPCLGLNDTLSEDWSRVFVASGYVAVALENIKPRNMQHCLSNGHTRRPFAGWIGDAYGALDHLSRLPYADVSRAAVIGYSSGGIILAKYMADDLATPSGHSFRAMVSIYAHCNGDKRPGGPPVSGTPRVPWLVLNGSLERTEMKGPCSELRGRPNVTVELIEGAHHGWDGKKFTSPHTDPAGNVMLYSKEATEKSHQIVLDFLAKHLKK